MRGQMCSADRARVAHSPLRPRTVAVYEKNICRFPEILIAEALPEPLFPDISVITEVSHERACNPIADDHVDMRMRLIGVRGCDIGPDIIPTLARCRVAFKGEMTSSTGLDKTWGSSSKLRPVQIQALFKADCHARSHYGRNDL